MVVCHFFASRKRRPSGQAQVELVLGAIIFVLMMGLTGTMSAYLYLQHAFITAARDGARVGAMDPNFANGGASTATASVKSAVIDFAGATTGQVLTDGDITVTPPDMSDPVGERSVEVEINYDMANPLNVEGLITALTGSTHGLDTIPIYARAAMRYEE